MQQLRQKGEGASQPPPCGRYCAHCPTDQQRDVPSAVDPQYDSHPRVKR
jgi:hypothetical protein